MIVDPHLTWKHHIAHISSKIAKGLGILCKAKHILNEVSLVTLYYSFVNPYLLYCNLVWGKAPTHCLDKLAKLQKRAVRIITKSAYLEHTEPIFKRLKILNLAQINILLTALFMYKIDKSELPNCFNNFFVTNNAHHSYNTRHAENIRVPKHKTNIVKNTIRVYGPRVWNIIMPDVKNCSFNVFKKRMKDILISKMLDDML